METSWELDPRVRRSRQRLQEALMQLLEEQAYADISITDITRRADLARVTFYQHFESKEALLLSVVEDFFVRLYEGTDTALAEQFVESGKIDVARQLAQRQAIDPAQMRLVQVALENIGPVVRELAIASFLPARPEGLDAEQRQIVATYHVAGALALLEKYLQGKFDISLERATLIPRLFLRALRLEAIDNGLLDEVLEKADDGG
jgi:AcrR family transcriptional regulator